MKKIILIVTVFLIIIAGGYYYFVNSLQVNEVDQEVYSMDLFDVLRNSEIAVPDSDIKVSLSKGEGEYEVVKGSSSVGIVTVLDDVYAIWEKDGRTDLSVIMATDTGGSGIFYYLVLFNVDKGVFTKKSEVFLGDRINVISLGLGELVHGEGIDYRLSVNIFTRTEDEPFSSEPTTPETKTFYVANQVLEEVDVSGDDS